MRESVRQIRSQCDANSTIRARHRADIATRRYDVMEFDSDQGPDTAHSTREWWRRGSGGAIYGDRRIADSMSTTKLAEGPPRQTECA
jgi:hypothetical protein